jgi:hypothetical protein
MPVMTDAPRPPGERRLDRPPSERYRDAPDTPDAEAPRPGSVGRAALAGAGVSLVGVVATVLLGGVLALSAGLLVVWAAAGNLTGTAVRVMGGTALQPPRRPALAAALALAGVALGAVGLWWYAGTEGGVLPLVDYLAETFGPIVPLQAVVAVAFAWWAAR